MTPSVQPSVVPIAKADQMTLPPTTTEQQDKTTDGQRVINRIWEYTQAFIAILVVSATMGAALYNVFHKATDQIPTILSVAFGTVVGFYFSRSNHQTVGGVGPKPGYPHYEGR